MAITYQHAMRFYGRPVIVYLRDGRRCCGYLRHVVGDGIYIEPMSGVRPVSSCDNQPKFTTADQAREIEIDPVFWGWLFFPFLALAALLPFFWW